MHFQNENENARTFERSFTAEFGNTTPGFGNLKNLQKVADGKKNDIHEKSDAND